MRPSSSTLRAIALAISAAACRGAAPDLVPHPSAIEPALGYPAAPVPVVIRGEAFYPRGIQNASGGSSVAVNHRAWLGDTELANVTWVDARTLRAVVPSGLPAGVQDLAVENALGARGTLPQAYRVLAGMPPSLHGSLAVAPSIGNPGTPVTIALTVANDGDVDAKALQPALQVSGTGGVSPAGAAPGPQDVPAHATVIFIWPYLAGAAGDVLFTVDGAAQDPYTGAAVAMPRAEATLDIALPTVMQLASDPFADGTPFSFVTAYQGQVWLGPSHDGTGLVRMNVDGSSPQSVALAIAKDHNTAGTTSTNTWSSSANGYPPYPSLGFSGCVANSSSCGPDNENGRGLFTSGVIAGTEWLVAVGARSVGSMDYVYMTTDSTSPLGLRYVDLSQELSAETRSASAAVVFHDSIYVGFPGKGAQSPFLLSLFAMPLTAPGLDPSGSPYAQTLGATKMPGIGAGGTPKNPASIILIDSVATFSDRLYVANNGGFVRSTTSAPRPYSTAPSDWSACTPATATRTTVTTTKLVDIEPADKTVPQMASFGGRLFALRNVYLTGTSGAVGGELWACTPSIIDAPGDAPQCGPNDWTLVVPAGAVDGRQAVTVLVATPQYLYLGFNAVGGAQLFRTAAVPTSLGDFLGQDGCAASVSGCPGLGGNGLGDPANTRFFDGIAIGDASGRASVFVAAGDTAAIPPVPVRVYRITE